MAHHDNRTDNDSNHNMELLHTHSDMHLGHHDHHNHGDMVHDFKKRFYISLIVTIPILILSPMIQSFIRGDWQVPYNQYNKLVIMLK